MESLKNIRNMTVLAMYEKKQGRQDDEITSFFKADYIYRKNLSLRIGMFFGCIIMIFLYYSYKIFVLEDDLFKYLTIDVVFDMLIFMAGVLIVFSVIGFFVHWIRYDKAKKRQEDFENRMERLDGVADED